MKKLIQPLIMYSSLLFGTMACDLERPVDIDISDGGRKLVVNSVLTSRQEMQVAVTLSKNILENDYDYPPVATATVIATSTNGLSAQLHYDVDMKRFVLPGVQPESNVDYSVQVAAPGYSTVSARTMMHDSVRITKVIKGGKAMMDEDRAGISYAVHFSDPPGKKNFYRMQVLGSYEIYSNDPSVREGHNGFGVLYFDDDLIDGKEVVMNVILPEYAGIEVPLVFQLENLSEGLYLYLESADLQSDVDGDPFAQPVTVYSNIENGFGIFGSTAVSRMRFEE